jgi:ABC-type nitrate/sulfonate/bicarbonate transport system permease component
MLVAIPVVIAIGASRIARGILDPIIEFVRPLPPLAYATRYSPYPPMIGRNSPLM